MTLPPESKDGDVPLKEREPPADLSLLNERYEIPISWASEEVRKEYLDLMDLIDRKIDDAAIGELYGRTAEM
jgi:hypothetical protein